MNCMDEWIGAENSVRVINAWYLVDVLKIDELGFAKAKPAHPGGRPSYPPKDLLKLYF